MSADVVTLERELRDLWKQMAEKTQVEGEQAVTRACVHNLVVYAPGQRSETELSGVLSHLMIDQPGRVILMLPDPSGPDSMSAWVNAQCHRTSGQRQQVCSEQIVIRAGGAEVRNLPSMVIPLVAPDLPVFFWWRDDLNSEWEFFQEVAANADRVILDSARFSRPVDSLKELMAISKNLRDSGSVSDLNWNRVTAWRQMIAGFFDHGACRKSLGSISEVEVQAFSPTGFSAQSLMLTSWLASRLQWTPLSGGNNAMMMDANGQRIRIRISVRPLGDSAIARGISTVTLRSVSPPITYHMTLDPETRYLRGTIDLEGRRPIDRSSRLTAGMEDECLNSELEILGADRIYEQTMNLLERMM